MFLSKKMSWILYMLIEEGRNLIGGARRGRRAARQAQGGTVSEKPRRGDGVGKEPWGAGFSVREILMLTKS